MTRRLPMLAAALVALALVGTMLIPAGTARANGVPVPVALKYIDLSNWGPEDATGNAELMFAEGILRLEATGLERLSGRLYQVWLVNSEAGDAISAGRFNAAADGSVDFTGSLPPISDFGFDLLILTVEAEPDDAPQPTEDRSIGGYFSLVGQPGADGNQTAAGGLGAPGQLPNTGDPGLISDLVRFAALLGAMFLSVFVGLRLGRRAA
jgi:hypothetical protein